MAFRAVARQGDKTSHGGTITGGFPELMVYGRPAAGIGHVGFCPKCGVIFQIVAGAATVTVFGRALALEGMKTSCGAVLIASQNQYMVDDGTGDGHAAASDSAKSNAVASRVVSPSASGASTKVPSEAAPAFDEQIRFIAADSYPVADTPYKLTLADGSLIAGRTDQDGKSERIETVQALAISCAEFYPDMIYTCECGFDHACETGGRAPEPALKVDLEGIKTNNTAVGSSVVEQKLPESTAVRPMTAGEIAMARTVYQEGIDYAKVKIHKGGLFGQPNRNGNAMTPKGEIHFPDVYFKPDFSTLTPEMQVWFMHELGHVWQYQLGYSVVWAGMRLAAKGGYSPDDIDRSSAPAYRYNLQGQDKGKTLPDFNMEQQADLFAHYFAAVKDLFPRYAVQLHDLKIALAGFLKNPKDASLLPNTTTVEPSP